MVSIRNAKKGFRLRKRGSAASGACSDFVDSVIKAKLEDPKKAGMVAVCTTLAVLAVLVWVFFQSEIQAQKAIEKKNLFQRLRKTKKHPHLQDPAGEPVRDTMNAVALDIYEVLDCESFLNSSVNQIKSDKFGVDELAGDEQQQPRRLQEEENQHGDDKTFQFEKGEAEGPGDDKYGGKANYGAEGGLDGPSLDDDHNDGDDWGDPVATNGRHLFCLAAAPDPPAAIVKRIQCDVTQSKRSTLLRLWSSARSQIVDPAMLRQVLELAHERVGESILGHSYNLWAPENDDGTQFVIAQLNSDKDVDNGGISGLSESLGEGKLFVDMGSCLGLTTLAVTNKYPGTLVVSIEPAAPNWLMQEMNLRCNLDDDTFRNKIKVVLAGVGPNDSDEDNMMAKLLWRSSKTTEGRAWTPENETPEFLGNKDIELLVRLRKLKSILAEAEIYGPHTIDVLNVDCSGCEYNLIPALSAKEFEAIPTIMGGVHWGYIPTSKLPSSKRGEITHKRLCSHENVAHRTKECCAFPDLPVQSSVPGEVLVKDEGNSAGAVQKQSTVMDVIMDGLCDNFDEWAENHHLFTVPDDWGWFELTSRAAV